MKKWQIYVFPILIALIFSIRELLINRSLWIDEAFSFFQSQMPLVSWIAMYPLLFLLSIIFLALAGYLFCRNGIGRKLTAFGLILFGLAFMFLSKMNPKDVHPPFYYLLLKGWISIVWITPYALRSLSLVFFIASVVAIVYYCRKYYCDRVALIAGTLFAFSSTFVHFGTEIRMYSMLVFFTMLSFVWFRKLVENQVSGKDMILYYLFTIVLPFLHYLGLLFIAFEIGIFLWFRKSLKQAVKTFLPIVMACIPLAIFFVLQSSRIINIGLGFPAPSIMSWISSISFALNYPQYLAVAEGVVYTIWFFIALLVLFLMALYVVKRKDRWCSAEYILVIIPQLLGIIFMGLLLNKYHPRFFLLFLWLIPVLLAQAINFVIEKKKYFGYALLILILASMSLAYACSYSSHEIQDVIRDIPKGSIIVHDSISTFLPFEYYLRGTFYENYIFTNLSASQLRAVGSDAIDKKQIIKILPKEKFYYVQAEIPIENMRFIKDYNGIELWESENNGTA